MSERKKRLKYMDLFLIAVIALVVIGLVFAFVELTSGHEELTSTDESRGTVSSLSCTGENLGESFFDITDTSSTKQEVKMAFRDDRINTIMYTLDAEYDEKTVSAKEAGFHAKYNDFMMKHGLSPDSIEINYSSIDTKAKVKLYAEKKSLNSITAELFLLDPANYSSSGKALKHFYEDKGFICQYKK